MCTLCRPSSVCRHCSCFTLVPGGVNNGDNGRMQCPPEVSLLPAPFLRGRHHGTSPSPCDSGVGRFEKAGPLVFDSNVSSCVATTMTTQTLFWGNAGSLRGGYTAKQVNYRQYMEVGKPPLHLLYPPTPHPHPRPGGGSATPISLVILNLVSRNARNCQTDPSKRRCPLNSDFQLCCRT